MNAIAGLTSQSADCSRNMLPEPGLHILRRTGRKAVKFRGWQMVEAVGAGDTARMWYDLALYRSESGQIIVELVARRRRMLEQDLFRVEIFDTLAAASAWLEAYPCASDVPVPPALADDAAPMAQAVLQGLQLRQRVARITDDFQSLLSDVFELLDVTEPVPQSTDVGQPSA